MKCILLFLVAVVGGSEAKADTVTYTVIPGVGLFSYNFTLTNTGDSGGTLFDLFLALPVDISVIDPTTIGTPVGWGDPTGGLLFFGANASPSTSFVEWAADASGLYDVGINNSLSGFSFTSSKEVLSPITFALNGATTFDVAEPVSGVPEPSSLMSLAVYLICLGFWERNRIAGLALVHPPPRGPNAPWEKNKQDH